MFADASHCPNTHAGGWGSWTIRDNWGRGKIRGGIIFEKVVSASEAEMWAVCYSLRDHAKQGHLSGDNTIMLQTDNIGVIQKIMERVSHASVRAHADSAPMPKGVPPITKADNKALEEIQGYLNNFDYVYLRHVRGHQDSGEAGRNWVNNMCDREAKRHMRSMRQSIYRKRG